MAGTGRITESNLTNNLLPATNHNQMSLKTRAVNIGKLKIYFIYYLFLFIKEMLYYCLITIRAMSDTPSELMFKNIEPEVMKALKELGVKNIDFGGDFIDFTHKGYDFQLLLIHKKPGHYINVNQNKSPKKK